MLIAQACMCSQGRWKLADAWITCLAHGHGAASCRCTRSHQFLAFHRWLHSSRGRGSCNMQMPSEKWRRRSHAMQQPPAAYTLQAYGSAPRGAYTVRGSSSPWRACLPCRVARVGRTRSPKRRSRDVADPAAEDVTSRGFLSSLQLPVRSSPETKRRAVSRRRAHNRTRGYRSMARLGRQTADPIATTQHPRRSRRPRWARDDFAAFKNTHAATATARALPPPRAK
jgi:hypothetical protein